LGQLKRRGGRRAIKSSWFASYGKTREPNAYEGPVEKRKRMNESHRVLARTKRRSDPLFLEISHEFNPLAGNPAVCDLLNVRGNDLLERIGYSNTGTLNPQKNMGYEPTVFGNHREKGEKRDAKCETLRREAASHSPAGTEMVGSVID